MNKYSICQVFLVCSVMLQCAKADTATPATVRFAWANNPGEITNITTPAPIDVDIRNAQACYSMTSGRAMQTLHAIGTGRHSTDATPHIGSAKLPCFALNRQRNSAEVAKDPVSSPAGLVGSMSAASGRAVNVPVPSTSAALQVLYLHTDVLGSVVAESDSSGQLKTSTQYKPFGEVVNN